MQNNLNSKLILGTVQMGLPYGINNTHGKISLDDSLEILKYAFENNITTLDTAEAYGNAHDVIGTFHAQNPQKIFKVITKLPNQLNYNIAQKVDEYLFQLKVKQLDTLLFHSFSSYQNNIKNFDVFNQLKSNRKIKNLGVSVYTNVEIEQIIQDDHIDVIQLPFNLFDNSNLRGDILKRAKGKGKIIHTRSALLQGLFFKDSSDNNKTVKKLKNELLLLSEISKTKNASIPAIALSYCLHQSYIDQVLIGVDSKDQLIDNIKSVNYKINTKTIDSINTIKIENTDLLNPSLWK